MENNINTMIDFLIKGSMPIVGVIVGYLIANKKYIFQKTYDQKLLCLIDLYKQIVRLEFVLKRYVHFIGAEMTKDSIDNKIETLNEIKKDFQKFQHGFWEMEIVLDDNTTDKIKKFLEKYIEITSKLTVSNINQQLGDLEQSNIKWNESFKLVSSDLIEIKDKIKIEFKKTLKKGF
ncbi:MAG: hypothetical protein UU96_C0002G0002 [Parcubacteria group bacterium GW2011_GWC2_42_13]|nr:MAG: hypothetical protein UU96_C0002G0002 [Parcubacteria group bacterium GW2011_GWC2_42_13]